MVRRRTVSAFGSFRTVLPYRITRFVAPTGEEGPQVGPQWHGSTDAEGCPCVHSADAASPDAPFIPDPAGYPLGPKAQDPEFVAEGFALSLNSCIRSPGKERMSPDSSRRPTFGLSDVSVTRWRETQGARVEVIEVEDDDNFTWNLSRAVAGAAAEAWAPTGGTLPACYQLQAAKGCKTGLARPVLRDPSFAEALAQRDALELQSELHGGVDVFDYPCYEEAGYRLIFAPRESGVSHLDVPGPPRRVKLIPAPSDTHDTACPSADNRLDMQPWIVDSGASFHVLSRDDLKVLKHCDIRPIPQGDILIHTANGDVIVKEEARVFVEQLQTWLWCRVMPNCPRLLSLGLLCSRDDFTFTWLAGQSAPTLLMPVGRSRGQRAVRMIVQGNCPMLPSKHDHSCYLDDADINEMIKKLEVHGMFHQTRDQCLGSTEGEVDEFCFPSAEESSPAVPPEHKTVLDQRLLAKTREHLMSHFPKNPWCPACQRATARRAQCRDRGGNAHIGERFGSQVTADHVVVSVDVSSDPRPSRDGKGLGGEKYGLCFKDLGTGYCGFFPTAHRDTPETERIFNDFLGDAKVRLLRTDGASEFKSTSTNLFIPHCTSTPGRHETNGVAERNIQKLSAAARTLLEQSGLEHCFWPYAGRMAAFGLNTQVIGGGECLESQAQ